MEQDSVQDIADLARERQLGIINVTDPTIRAEPIPLALVRKENGDIYPADIKKLLDPWREFPERRAGTGRMLTLQSLIDFANRHKGDASAVFGEFLHAAAPKIAVVFDYHELDGTARHGKHRAEYAFPISDEWKLWNSKNSTGDKAVKFDQADFAMFIEDRVMDLASPDDTERGELEEKFGTKFATPSEMLSLSRGLDLNISSRVKEVRNLQTGEAQVMFDEVHEDGKGKPMKVPGLFVVRIPLFVGGGPVRIVTRLRYRKDGVGLAWFIQMYRPDLVIRERLTADLAEVGDKTGLPTFEGTPEVSA